MKKWSADNPKAALMEQKRTAIVAAARESFLESGYSQASMDGIARLAGVSVKTIYGHFENKRELFSAVMRAACLAESAPDALQDEAALSARFPWFTDATERGLAEAGREYLRHLLSTEQLALYRVVTRDADRFPELGVQYQKDVVAGRTDILMKYLGRAAQTNKWRLTGMHQASTVYEALLRAGLFEEVLHGIRHPEPRAITRHACSAADVMWKLMEAGILRAD
jgi:TetR/AcrR family transcriptional repressor of mexJK operon